MYFMKEVLCFKITIFIWYKVRIVIFLLFYDMRLICQKSIVSSAVLTYLVWFSW
jgi:hypothetical protein